MAYMKQGQWQESGDVSELQHVDVFNEFSSLEKGRFHLYVSYGCPFAHRALLAVSILGLEDFVSVSSVAPLKDIDGWEFSEEYPDPLESRDFLYQVYQDAKNDYSGRVSVPVLWDKKFNTIVSNDSLEITLWLAKQDHSKYKLDLISPFESQQQDNEIEEQCQWINSHINTLPFKAGFTNNQIEYKEAATAFFNNLAVLDEKFAHSKYFSGATISLSDLLILPTLVQLELVYSTHFKLNAKPLSHFKHINKYLINLMGHKTICSTFHIDFIKTTYFAGQPAVNPSRIIPIGPSLNWQSDVECNNV